MSSFDRCVVLAADDEPVVLGIVTQVLARHGYIVIPAENGPRALNACRGREGPIHLALLDMLMPGMTGPEVYARIREIHPNISVLFMSGFQPEMMGEIVPPFGSVNFIAKPFLPRELVQRVNKILGNTDVCSLLEESLVGTG